MKRFILTIILIVFITSFSNAQKIKFGKVSKAELEEKFYPQDSSANAVILFKKRRSIFEYVKDVGWVISTKVHLRIKLYNKDGYNWATKEIELYQGGSDDETVSIKANTFNLVNGKVEKIKLKSNQIFTEEVNKYWKRKKFTLPSLTEGCVIEWEYTFKTQYFSHLNDMVFQYGIPLKFIDTQVKIPEYFVFKYLPSTYYPVKVHETTKNRTININYKTRTQSGGFGGGASKTSFNTAKVDFIEKIYSSIQKTIPALRDEPFTSSINNYRSKVSFELTAYRPKNGIPKFYNNNWEDVTKTIYENSSFGGQLEKSSYFKDDLNQIISNTTAANEKLLKVFQFVKNKMKWNNFNGIYTTKSVKKAYKEGVGNVAEINIILVAMLREAGIDANPILVSTRNHGIPLFPTKKGFNYVIAGVEKEGNVILLDATEKYSLPNTLPLRVLNWQGRIVRKSGSSNAIDLFPKKHSKETCFVKASIDEEGIIKGIERDVFANLEALQKRTKNNSTSENDFLSKLEKEYDAIEINEFKATNKEDLSKSLTYQFKFEADNQAEIIGGKIYFAPLLFHTKKENPFTLDKRAFPVDFGSPWEEKYTLSITFPEGYQVDSKPDNVGYSLPENLGSFKFVTTVSANKIQIVSHTKINIPLIASNYYETLKSFYKMMIEKQLEKVVLVKK